MVFVQRPVFYARMKASERIYRDRWLNLLKKRKKVFLWIAVVILALCLLTSLFVKPGIDASFSD